MNIVDKIRNEQVKSDVADKSSISILGGYSVITCEFLLDVRVTHPVAARYNKQSSAWGPFPERSGICYADRPGHWTNP